MKKQQHSAPSMIRIFILACIFSFCLLSGLAVVYDFELIDRYEMAKKIFLFHHPERKI